MSKVQEVKTNTLIIDKRTVIKTIFLIRYTHSMDYQEIIWDLYLIPTKVLAKIRKYQITFAYELSENREQSGK